MTSETVKTSLCLLVLVLGVVLGSCPDNLGDRCTCDDDVVGCFGIASLDQLQPVAPAHPLPSLELSECHLPYLNASWLRLKQTERLSIDHSILVSLFERPPSDPLPLLKEVEVLSCRLLRGFRWSELRAFAGLQSLYVRNTGVWELGEEFRANVSPQLNWLRLSGANVSSLEGEPFRGKKQLQKIFLDECSIRELKNSYFEDQKESLTAMDFSHNPIQFLPADLFEGFGQQLESFYLTNSGIQTIQEGWRSSLLRLTNLNLIVSGNDLVCDCRMKWVVEFRARMYGACVSPAELQSRDLQELSDQDFAGCNALPFEQ